MFSHALLLQGVLQSPPHQCLWFPARLWVFQLAQLVPLTPGPDHLPEGQSLPGSAAWHTCRCACFTPMSSTDVSGSPIAFIRGSAAAVLLTAGSGENTSLWTLPKVRESKDWSVLATAPGLVLSPALLCLTPALKSILGSAFWDTRSKDSSSGSSQSLACLLRGIINK